MTVLSPEEHVLAQRGHDDRRPEAWAVIRAVASERLLSAFWVIGPSRSQAAVAARDAVALILRDRGFTMRQIGLALHRDHSTIVAAIKRAEKRK